MPTWGISAASPSASRGSPWSCRRLLLNYLGQGALVLADPSPATLVSPFHRLAPDWFSMPLVILGAMAAIIASQALISGAFSLTMQAVQMGYLPRMPIDHTSESEHGQIYIGVVNRAIMVGSIALVLAFQTSSNLAAAYGIAVCLTMFITSILLTQIALRRWHWPMWKTLLICGLVHGHRTGLHGGQPDQSRPRRLGPARASGPSCSSPCSPGNAGAPRWRRNSRT